MTRIFNVQVTQILPDSIPATPDSLEKRSKLAEQLCYQLGADQVVVLDVKDFATQDDKP